MPTDYSISGMLQNSRVTGLHVEKRGGLSMRSIIRGMARLFPDLIEISRADYSPMYYHVWLQSSRHHLSVGRVVHRPLPDGRVMKSCSEAGI